MTGVPLRLPGRRVPINVNTFQEWIDHASEFMHKYYPDWRKYGVVVPEVYQSKTRYSIDLIKTVKSISEDVRKKHEGLVQGELGEQELFKRLVTGDWHRCMWFHGIKLYPPEIKLMEALGVKIDIPPNAAKEQELDFVGVTPGGVILVEVKNPKSKEAALRDQRDARTKLKLRAEILKQLMLQMVPAHQQNIIEGISVIKVICMPNISQKSMNEAIREDIERKGKANHSSGNAETRDEALRELTEAKEKANQATGIAETTDKIISKETAKNFGQDSKEFVFLLADAMDDKQIGNWWQDEILKKLNTDAVDEQILFDRIAPGFMAVKCLEVSELCYFASQALQSDLKGINEQDFIERLFEIERRAVKKQIQEEKKAKKKGSKDSAEKIPQPNKYEGTELQSQPHGSVLVNVAAADDVCGKPERRGEKKQSLIGTKKAAIFNKNTEALPQHEDDMGSEVASTSGGAAKTNFSMEVDARVRMPLCFWTFHQWKAWYGNSQILIGPPGSGKTMLVQWNIVKAIKSGQSTLVLLPMELCYLYNTFLKSLLEEFPSTNILNVLPFQEIIYLKDDQIQCLLQSYNFIAVDEIQVLATNAITKLIQSIKQSQKKYWIVIGSALSQFNSAQIFPEDIQKEQNEESQKVLSEQMTDMVVVKLSYTLRNSNEINEAWQSIYDQMPQSLMNQHVSKAHTIPGPPVKSVKLNLVNLGEDIIKALENVIKKYKVEPESRAMVQKKKEEGEQKKQKKDKEDHPVQFNEICILLPIWMVAGVHRLATNNNIPCSLSPEKNKILILPIEACPSYEWPIVITVFDERANSVFFTAAAEIDSTYVWNQNRLYAMSRARYHLTVIESQRDTADAPQQELNLKQQLVQKAKKSLSSFCEGNFVPMLHDAFICF